MVVDWFKRPQGQAVTAAENALLTALLAKLPPAQEALGIGLEADNPLLGTLACRSRWCYTLSSPYHGLATVPLETPEKVRLCWGEPEALPFPSSFLNRIVLIHILEFSQTPYQVLAECERVLAPHGRLMVFCFNPVSLFGIMRPFMRYYFKEGPWDGKFQTGFGLSRMLNSLRLNRECKLHLIYRLPGKGARALACFETPKPGLLRHRLPFGGVVCLQARKDKPSITLVGPALSKRPSPSPDLRGASLPL